MRAVTAVDGRIEISERPAPEPGPGEVLVRVTAAGLNRADLLQRAGLYPPPRGVPADIPGLEFSGEVVAHSDGVSAPAIGRRVFGIVAGGAQAELLVVHASHCAVVPDALDLVTAGGVPEVFLTAHDALCTQAALQPGERVLVHAAGSGVGTALIQIAGALGCPVTGTARTEDKLDRAHALGMDHGVVAPRDLDPIALAQSIAEAGAPDVVIDLVGGAYVTADVLAAAPHARIVLVGALAGGSADLPILAVMNKRLRILGTVLRTRSVEEKAAATAAFTVEIAPFLARGEITPVVERVLDLDDAPAAYELLASDATFGKVILRVH